MGLDNCAVARNAPRASAHRHQQAAAAAAAAGSAECSCDQLQINCNSFWQCNYMLNVGTMARSGA